VLPGHTVTLREDAAREGVEIVNESSTEPLVMLKHFGPGHPQLSS
jgi:hypothetical protein